MFVLLPQLLRAFNVFVLCALVAAREQHDDHGAGLPQVDPVARPEVQSQLYHAPCERFVVAEITDLQPGEASTNAGARQTVFDASVPVFKRTLTVVQRQHFDFALGNIHIPLYPVKYGLSRTRLHQAETAKRAEDFRLPPAHTPDVSAQDTPAAPHRRRTASNPMPTVVCVFIRMTGVRGGGGPLYRPPERPPPLRPTRLAPGSPQVA